MARDQLALRLAAQRRHAAGRRFEEILDLTHRGYQARGLGKVIPHYPRTIRTPKGPVYAKGGAPIDYSGVLRVKVDLLHPRDIIYEVTPFTVAFDAKVLDEHHVSYRHPKAQYHQLLELMAFEKCGALAFLLFYDREAQQLIVVHGVETFETLLAGKTVQVRKEAGEEKCPWPTTPNDQMHRFDYRSILGALVPKQ